MKISSEGLPPMPGGAIVIEDDPTLRELMKEIIEELGVHCTAFESADDALIHMLQSSEECSLVIADHGVLGNIQGAEFVGMVHEKWPKIPTILTSGYLLDASKLPPSVLYLLKPWSIDELVAAISKLLRSNEPEESTLS